MLRHLIFHLNILADPALLRSYYQQGLARIMQQRYGQSQQFWAEIQAQLLADWASYHADLNYSSDESMSDMLEGRFRVTRALFRLAQLPEPPKHEITQLAEDLISQAPQYGDAFFHDSKNLLQSLYEQNFLTTIISYYPERQLRAILCGGNLEEIIAFAIGADTFEHYEMDTHYFEFLLNKLNTQASECLYIDSQANVLMTAEKLGIKIWPLASNLEPHSWLSPLQQYIQSWAR